MKLEVTSVVNACDTCGEHPAHLCSYCGEYYCNGCEKVFCPPTYAVAMTMCPKCYGKGEIHFIEIMKLEAMMDDELDAWERKCEKWVH